MPCEIIIDLDNNPTEEVINWICNDLDKEGLQYECYNTSSRGYHIHIFLNSLANNDRSRELIRKYFIGKYGADILKASDKTMIAIENMPHWKTGKKKELFKTNKKRLLYDELTNK